MTSLDVTTTVGELGSQWCTPRSCCCTIFTIMCASVMNRFFLIQIPSSVQFSSLLRWFTSQNNPPFTPAVLLVLHTKLKSVGTKRGKWSHTLGPVMLRFRNLRLRVDDPSHCRRVVHFGISSLAVKTQRSGSRIGTVTWNPLSLSGQTNQKATEWSPVHAQGGSTRQD